MMEDLLQDWVIKGKKDKWLCIIQRDRSLDEIFIYEWNQKDDAVWQVKSMSNVLVEMDASILKFC